MIPYFVLFGTWMLGSIQFASRKAAAYERIFYVAALVLTILMVGFRYEVGGDWITYQDMYADISMQSLATATRFTEPAYAFLNWVSAKVDGGVYIPNLGCALVFMLGLSALVRRQTRPWLAMTVAIPYLVIVVGMGYTRQAAAIGMICWAIAGIDDDKLWKTIAKVVFGALFHKTAILFLPILLAPAARRNLLIGIVGALAFIGLAFIALGGSSDRLVTNYVNSDYQSSGAAIRVAMNVLAAGLFLIFRKRFAISPAERLIWTIASGLAVVSVIGLASSSSSVGVDRLALFLIPLQVFVLANIPSIASFTASTRSAATLAVIGYSLAVQYVYFFHGTFSYTWLPYRNALVITDRGADS